MSKIDEEFMSTRPRETQTRFDYVLSVGARLFRGLSIDAKRDLDDFEGRNDEPYGEPETEEDALDIPAAEETPEIVDPFARGLSPLDRDVDAEEASAALDEALNLLESKDASIEQLMQARNKLFKVSSASEDPRRRLVRARPLFPIHPVSTTVTGVYRRRQRGPVAFQRRRINGRLEARV